MYLWNATVAKAEGEAKRFEEIYTSYKDSKDITKKRLYLDVMETIYNNSNKTIIDQGISKNVLPFLPLNNQKK